MIRCNPDGGASDGGTVCADTQNDPLNCGGCGGSDLPTPTPTPTPAPANPPPPQLPPHICIGTPGANTVGVCSDGHCGFICEGGFGDCTADERPSSRVRPFAQTLPPPSLSLQPGENACFNNFASDSCNCGGCGIACSGNFSDGPQSCFAEEEGPDLQTCCGASCVNLNIPSSCGSCGNVTTCNGGTPDCCPTTDNTSNACTSVASDVNNCGSCGNNCNFDGLTLPLCCASVVSAGPSQSQCTEGASTANCGSCGNSCTGTNPGCCLPQPGATPSPSPGADPCTDLVNDTHNCGSCGHDCKTECGSDGCNNNNCNCDG